MLFLVFTCFVVFLLLRMNHIQLLFKVIRIWIVLLSLRVAIYSSVLYIIRTYLLRLFNLLRVLLEVLSWMQLRGWLIRWGRASIMILMFLFLGSGSMYQRIILRVFLNNRILSRRKSDIKLFHLGVHFLS